MLRGIFRGHLASFYRRVNGIQQVWIIPFINGQWIQTKASLGVFRPMAGHAERLKKSLCLLPAVRTAIRSPANEHQRQQDNLTVAFDMQHGVRVG